MHRDAGALILHHDLDAVRALRPHLQAHAGAGRGVFDRVLEHVADGLRQDLAVADHAARLDLPLDALAMFFGDGFVELGEIGGERADIHLLHRIARQPGLRAADIDQGVEGLQGARRLGLGLREMGLPRHRVGGLAGRLDRASHAHERRAKVVREALGDRAQARHQRLVLVEHLVEGAGELPHRIQPLALGRARRGLTAQDLACRRGEAGGLLEDVAVEGEARQQPHRDDHQRADQPRETERAQDFARRRIATADDEGRSVLETQTRRVADPAVRLRQAHPSRGHLEDFATTRDVGEVADEPATIGIDQRKIRGGRQQLEA